MNPYTQLIINPPVSDSCPCWGCKRNGVKDKVVQVIGNTIIQLALSGDCAEDCPEIKDWSESVVSENYLGVAQDAHF